MKISIIVARFAITGVPLAQMKFASALATKGHEVNLLIGFKAEEVVLPDVPGVKVTVLNRPKVRSLISDFVSHFRSREPDIVFTAEDHLNAVVLLSALIARSKAKISCSSRVNPFDTYSTRLFSKGWSLKLIMNALMWRADVLTCVSEGMVAQYQSLFRNSRHVCVYNIVDTPIAREKLKEPLDKSVFDPDPDCTTLVAAGQLAPWKGFSDLISAIYLVAKKHKVRLVILGEGPLRADLEAQIKALGMEEVISLVGHVNNPLKYFSAANVFVLSSLLEGMPNVLIEAMMAGCTPVATDCPTGPREILESGRFGYLVPVNNPSALAGAIERAIEHPVSPDVLNEALAPFHQDAVIEKHFRLLEL